MIAILVVQTVTHLAWLPISGHSGQVAIPWMMNQGMTLFGTLLEQHAPATSVIAALAMRLLPIVEPVLVTRLLNLGLVLTTTLLVFWVARRLSGDLAGIAAAAMWFWWEPVYGNILFYFDGLVGLMVLLALVVWLRFASNQPGWRATMAVGLLMGGATLAKQHGWLPVVLFGGWLFVYARHKLGAYVVGVVVLPLAEVGIVTLQGDLQAYLYWNWQFNLSGFMETLLPSGDLVRKLLLSNLFVPVFALLAWRRKDNRNWLLLCLLWLGTLVDLLPRFADSQAMAHLPFACVMAGMVVAALLSPGGLSSWRPPRAAVQVALATLTVAVLVAWLWTGAAPYFSAPLGRAGIPAYDEFKPLAAALNAISHPGDTLIVLPETDSTPQIHPLSGLLPPGTWIKGWRWYFQAPGMLDSLLDAWISDPPTYIVYFPDLIVVGQPEIEPLVAFMNAHYQLAQTIPNVVFHGDALVYRYDSASQSVGFGIRAARHEDQFVSQQPR